MGLEWKNSDHEMCIIDEAAKLMDRGFSCYLEYEIITPCRKYFVDIYGVKGNKEIIIEVGTLSRETRYNQESRLAELKQIMPQAKIVHIHQWKNYYITEGSMLQFAFENELKRLLADPKRRKEEQQKALEFRGKQFQPPIQM